MKAGSEWNYADVWEAIAETIPEAVAQVQGCAPAHVGRARPARRRHRRDVVGRGRRAGRQGRRVSLQRARVPRESFFAAVKIGLVPVNTNYRYGARRARVPLERLRRGCGRLPRLVHRAGRRRAVAGSGRAGLVARRRRHRAVPGVGGALRAGRRVERRANPRRGVAAATTSSSCTRAGRPGCRRA